MYSSLLVICGFFLRECSVFEAQVCLKNNKDKHEQICLGALSGRSVFG